MYNVLGFTTLQLVKMFCFTDITVAKFKHDGTLVLSLDFGFDTNSMGH